MFRETMQTIDASEGYFVNPSYFRIKVQKDEAIDRLCNWTNGKPIESIETSYSKAVSVACIGGKWKGIALYVYQNEDWTVFEDLTGAYSSIPAEKWLEFAENEPLVVAGYNDAIVYAELIAIEKNQISKVFYEHTGIPEAFRNTGTLSFEDIKPIESWIDVAAFVDGDDLAYSDNGTVLIF